MAYRSPSMAYRRGGNICADALAKLGANQPAELLIVNDSPSEIRSTLVVDIVPGWG